MKEPADFFDLDKLDEEEKNMWLSAIDRELNAMERYLVWETLYEVPKGIRLIDTRWMFRVKNALSGSLAKGRLVAKRLSAAEAE